MTHVLVVDDDQEIRHSLRFLFRDAGYEVLEAGDGSAGLEALRSADTPLVALVDLLMPRVSGVALLGAAADDPLLASRQAYIVLTADTRALLQSSEPAVRRLAASVVQKPFDVDALLAAVAQGASRLTSSPA